jgi:hypothetical protein
MRVPSDFAVTAVDCGARVAAVARVCALRLALSCARLRPARTEVADPPCNAGHSFSSRPATVGRRGAGVNVVNLGEKRISPSRRGEARQRDLLRPTRKPGARRVAGAAPRTPARARARGHVARHRQAFGAAREAGQAPGRSPTRRWTSSAAIPSGATSSLPSSATSRAFAGGSADTTSALTAAAIPTASTARAPELETWSADGTGSAASRSG